MRRPVARRLGHHVGELLEASQELELAIVDQEDEVDVVDRLALRCRARLHSGRSPPMRACAHLDVEDRVLHRLLRERGRGRRWWPGRASS